MHQWIEHQLEVVWALRQCGPQALQVPVRQGCYAPEAVDFFRDVWSTERSPKLQPKPQREEMDPTGIVRTLVMVSGNHIFSPSPLLRLLLLLLMIALNHEPRSMSL